MIRNKHLSNIQEKIPGIVRIGFSDLAPKEFYSLILSYGRMMSLKLFLMKPEIKRKDLPPTKVS
jgi:hypothetical protein